MAESQRRRVLVITYYWPPSGGAGVQRWLKTVKYLREFGWEPVLYIPSNPEAPVQDASLLDDVPAGLEIIRRPIWEPYSYYKKLVGLKSSEKINAGFLTEKKKPGLAENLSVWLRGNLFIPDARRFWIRPSVKFLSEYLRLNPVDAMVSTGPPHSMHLIALGIREKLGIPWLADFRDPWTGIDFYHQLRLTSAADRKHHFLEKSVLKSADAVTVISSSMRDEFKTIHPRKYELVTNGFDDSDIRVAAPVVPDAKFSLAHIGSIAPSRNPLVLWKVLSELVQENPGFGSHLLIKLVGKVDLSVISSIEASGLSAYLEKSDYLPHNQVVAVMQSSQLLLLLINQSPNAKGILTGKLFEYLAARRPVIAIGPAGGDAARILTDTGAGATSGFEDAVNLKKQILNHYRQYLQQSLVCRSRNIEKYSRRSLTQEIAAILEGISREISG